MSRETILVVDDSEFILDFLTELLGNQGFTVLTAPTCTEAIRTLESNHVDLMLTDLIMPGMGGMELVKLIHERYPNVTSLIMTGYASVESAREAIVYGALDYVFKPFKSAEILAAIEGSLERVRLRQENARLREALSISNASGDITAMSPHSNDLARTIVMSALTQTRTNLGALLVYDEDRAQLELRFSSGPELGEPGEFPIGSAFPVTAFEPATRGMLLVTPQGEHPLGGQVRHSTLRHVNFPAVLPIEQEALFVPLRAQSTLKGLLILSKKQGESPFAASDLPVVSIIASLGATSIDNASLVVTMEQNYVSTLISLNIMLEAKDPYTKGHTNRVVEFCVGIGRHLNLSSADLQNLREGAMLHDIGKLAISDAILNKPGALTEEEMNIVRQHPDIGDNIVRPIKFLQHSRPVVRHHHERWDGTGYPDRLKGEEISLFARICTIADAIDAMASARSYRGALTFPEIYDQVLMGSGTQFDENLVKIVLEMIERGEVGYLARPQKLVVG
jgi:response regulator RpfG family c-di-GMP phosphodiesterase